MDLPTPHGDKLKALLVNDKLPISDHPRVAEAVERYNEWLDAMGAAEGDRDDLLHTLVDALNGYKLYVDVDLIFDSPEDFLYRQKGQLKLDNTVVEEFIPWLVYRCFQDQLDGDLYLGPANCFAHLRFESDLRGVMPGGGITVRSKDQDFTIARKLYLRASHNADFADSVDRQTHIAYVAVEIKTNLDKTMFQEAAATAYDLKLAVPNASYILLCEWLDMTPISTTVTSIEEVIILRKAKRLASNVRNSFSSAAGRRAARASFVDHLRIHPYSVEAFTRFIDKIGGLLGGDEVEEDIVLGRGWF
jgi:hypothetical protein